LNVLNPVTSTPSQLVGLSKRKGTIDAGQDADLVVFNRSVETTVEAESLYSRHRWTPYLGRKLSGRVESTYLRGRKVFDHGQLIGEPRGHLLERGKP
jgi:allantoinase